MVGHSRGLRAAGCEGEKGHWLHNPLLRAAPCFSLLRPRVSEPCESPAQSSCNDPGQKGHILPFPTGKAPAGGVVSIVLGEGVGS